MVRHCDACESLKLARVARGVSSSPRQTRTAPSSPLPGSLARSQERPKRSMSAQGYSELVERVYDKPDKLLPVADLPKLFGPSLPAYEAQLLQQLADQHGEELSLGKAELLSFFDMAAATSASSSSPPVEPSQGTVSNSRPPSRLTRTESSYDSKPGSGLPRPSSRLSNGSSATTKAHSTPAKTPPMPTQSTPSRLGTPSKGYGQRSSPLQSAYPVRAAKPRRSAPSALRTSTPPTSVSLPALANLSHETSPIKTSRSSPNGFRPDRTGFSDERTGSPEPMQGMSTSSSSSTLVDSPPRKSDRPITPRSNVSTPLSLARSSPDSPGLDQTSYYARPFSPPSPTRTERPAIVLEEHEEEDEMTMASMAKDLLGVSHGVGALSYAPPLPPELSPGMASEPMSRGSTLSNGSSDGQRNSAFSYAAGSSSESEHERDIIASLVAEKHELTKKIRDLEASQRSLIESHDRDMLENQSLLAESQRELGQKRREEKELRIGERHQLNQIASLESDNSRLSATLDHQKELYSSLKTSFEEQCDESEKLRDIVRLKEQELFENVERTVALAEQLETSNTQKDFADAAIAQLEGDLASARQAEHDLEEERQHGLALKETIDRLRLDLDSLRLERQTKPDGEGHAATLSKSFGAELARLPEHSQVVGWSTSLAGSDKMKLFASISESASPGLSFRRKLRKTSSEIFARSDLNGFMTPNESISLPRPQQLTIKALETLASEASVTAEQACKTAATRLELTSEQVGNVPSSTADRVDKNKQVVRTSDQRRTPARWTRCLSQIPTFAAIKANVTFMWRSAKSSLPNGLIAHLALCVLYTLVVYCAGVISGSLLRPCDSPFDHHHLGDALQDVSYAIVDQFVRQPSWIDRLLQDDWALSSIS
ncbi:uncharacterized protein L969DRAFT_85415 [Mixia osmundae IAM 14324]|uniref:Uncharacterized protein n=1 Tax=Mixia osmundae (strain CBS 9802 / IAM 14324 / JCM 22182 / KY 12970) TaxID=764103 RepID=G7DYQ0_MIXOS|nr:uncharacterized protein L969DRAFT_85415 [Mixia osmundae IAM 14324]KEI41610.1 hypothetical protein L969DRAFT_85415 [Mixia osmundae IAM 14324]GAA95710.1 hypothetical protein E5Q_02367 [Mixia osmundae IAM 14324]